MSRTSDYKWKKLRDSLKPQIDVCNRCGIALSKDGRGAELHHILPYSKYPHLEYDLNNLMWLCESCNSSLRDSIVERTTYLNRNWVS